MYKPFLLAGALFALGSVTSSAGAMQMVVVPTGRSELVLTVANHDCIRDE
jgi:hypothetical protein